MTCQSIQHCITFLIARDERLAQAYAMGGPIPNRARPPGFQTLIQLLVEQQLSLASAAAIMRRVRDIIDPFTPQTLLSIHDDDLRVAGLSTQKLRYCHNLANACNNGTLDLTQLDRLDDDIVIQQLTVIKGIGPWTAQLYLLTALDRQDVLPAGDLALQVAAQHLYKLEAKPDIRTLTRMGDAWRPCRSIAARILWQYYRVLKNRDVSS